MRKKFIWVEEGARCHELEEAYRKSAAAHSVDPNDPKYFRAYCFQLFEMLVERVEKLEKTGKELEWKA